jgi:UDP-N-acetylmuramoyl-L-alanyl-D-glutamate--2,6-diaminopimelate ligase
MQVFQQLGAALDASRDSRADHARLCQRLAGDPSRRLTVIGVTGLSGKTTTSCLIAGVLTAAGYRIGLVGPLGYLDGRALEPAGRATPPPEKLASLLARMADNECSHAVMTVSSRALSESRVAGVAFDAMCVTWAGKAGKSPFSGLAERGFAVINADDRGAASWLRRLDRPALTVGIDTAAQITAMPLEQCPSEQTFLLTAGNETMPVRTQMIGKHHISNCLVAAAVGLAYNIELATVVRGLESVGHVPGRLERIECGQPFATFVDGARTPGALAGILHALRRVVAGRLICVFSADPRADRARRIALGAVAEKNADQVVLTSGSGRRRDGAQVFGDVLRGFECPAAATVMADRMTAIHWALGAARAGDGVVIAGAKTGTGSLGPGGPDDREAAEEWLRQHR